MFSILVPTFNRAKLLEKCLSSIKLQNHEEYEVFILDDNSSDNTAEIADKFCIDNRFNYVPFTSNNGFSANIRWVIDNNKNNFNWIIIICDDDRLSDELFLTRCHKAVADNSTVNPTLLLVDLIYQYSLFFTSTNDSLVLPSTFRKEELSEAEKLVLSNKFPVGFHVDLFSKYDLYSTKDGETYEQPYEKLYINESVCYAHKAAYVFLIHQQNRDKYLKIKQFITSMVLPELVSYRTLLGVFGRIEATKKTQNKINYILTDTSSTIPSLLDINLSFITDLLTPFFEDQDVCKNILFEVSELLENYYQTTVDQKISQLNSYLANEEEGSLILDRSANFAIYGATDWGKQIANQLTDMNKNVVCFIDDDSKDGVRIDELNARYAGSIEAIIIASGRPHVILSMINNIKRCDVDLPILSIIPV